MIFLRSHSLTKRYGQGSWCCMILSKNLSNILKLIFLGNFSGMHKTYKLYLFSIKRRIIINQPLFLELLDLVSYSLVLGGCGLCGCSSPPLPSVPQQPKHLKNALRTQYCVRCGHYARCSRYRKF